MFIRWASLVVVLVLLMGCGGTSKITITTTKPDGSVVTSVQEVTDEMAYVQAQEKARRPTLKITALDPKQPMTFSNVASLEVYGGESGGIKQYIHPGWDVAKTAFGVIGTVAGVYVSMDGATKLVGAVAGMGGDSFSNSFNNTGDQATTSFKAGDGSILTASPSDRHDTNDRHDTTDNSSSVPEE